MKWCTISDAEQTKCLWLKQAAIIQGVVPVIECVQTTGKIQCIESIAENQSDIVDLQDYIMLRKRYLKEIYTILRLSKLC